MSAKKSKQKVSRADREYLHLIGSVISIEDNLDFLERRMWVGVKRGEGFFIDKARMRQMIGEMSKRMRKVGQALRNQKTAKNAQK